MSAPVAISLHKTRIFNGLLSLVVLGVLVGSVVTNSKRMTPTGHPRVSMPSIEQLTSEARDLPAQSFLAH
jgi:hypothetical protein